MNKEHRPFGVTLAAVLLAFTLISLPAMVAYASADLGMFVIFYIPYAPLAAWLSWKVYPRREEIFWILQILAWATFALLCYSCFMPVYRI
ncbi:MAG: hypothetical protein K2N28_08070 [Muribaculaceae bacterium]|nr:hypothetical protein [Muribaculaceae bacterium]